jgi:hypothetical protein
VGGSRTVDGVEEGGRIAAAPGERVRIEEQRQVAPALDDGTVEATLPDGTVRTSHPPRRPTG